MEGLITSLVFHQHTKSGTHIFSAHQSGRERASELHWGFYNFWPAASTLAAHVLVIRKGIMPIDLQPTMPLPEQLINEVAPATARLPGQLSLL
jgi:hypothetical protein